MQFNLALAQQAASLCRDQPGASPEYAQALGVSQNVLDAQLALLVDPREDQKESPNEPEYRTKVYQRNRNIRLHRHKR